MYTHVYSERATEHSWDSENTETDSTRSTKDCFFMYNCVYILILLINKQISKYTQRKCFSFFPYFDTEIERRKLSYILISLSLSHTYQRTAWSHRVLLMQSDKVLCNDYLWVLNLEPPHKWSMLTRELLNSYTTHRAIRNYNPECKLVSIRSWWPCSNQTQILSHEQHELVTCFEYKKVKSHHTE